MHTIQDLPFFISICLLLVWVWSVSTICVCVCVSFEPGISLGDNPGSLCRCIFLFSPLMAFFYRLKCDLWETWLEGCPHSLTFTTRGTLFAGVTMERQMSLLKHSFPWPCCHAVKAAGRLQSFWGERKRDDWVCGWGPALPIAHVQGLRNDPALKYCLAPVNFAISTELKKIGHVKSVWELTLSDLCNANFKCQE